MSSSVSTTVGGVMVVTHVHPAPQGTERQHNVGIQKFMKAWPLVLGTVQIMIGLMVLLFGIVSAVNADTLGVHSGIFVWGALIYITAGSLTVAAGKSKNLCLTPSFVVVPGDVSMTPYAPPSVQTPLFSAPPTGIDARFRPEDPTAAALTEPPAYDAVIN